MKRCIFYLPYELDPTASRARMVRPRKMIQAFKDIGYDVFEITGYAVERKKKIHEIKNMISKGFKYDFMYSEASTMPTLLTEPKHYPTHPFLDFGFFKYIKKHDIPIGLFYPDIYWKFDYYGEDLPAWKRLLAIKNYEYDIKEYEKYLARFYIASTSVCELINSDKLTAVSEELLPGSDNLVVIPKSYENRDFTKEPLTVFYVGGVGEQYQITELVGAVARTPHTKLILCCRQTEWEKEKHNYEPYLNDSIEIIHKSGSELEAYYESADLCSLLFKPDSYREMAKPVKAFEYLAHELPVLATEGTGIGDFVKKTGIGWTIAYSIETISNTLASFVAMPELLQEKIPRCKEIKKANSWTRRALQVEEGLIEKNETY